MLILLQNHAGEYRTGAYFTKYPTLPLKEAGRVFRFKEKKTAGSKESALLNLEYGARTRRILTSFDLSWQERAYVLIDNTVWRIEAWSCTEIGAQAVMPLKIRQRLFTLELSKVDNASEVRM